MASPQYLETHGDHDTLVIVLHGYSNSSDRLTAVRETITNELPNADIFAPLLPFAQGWVCLRKAESIVADLMNEIEKIVSDGKYKSIIFVGHSFGAVLARRLVVTAFGEQIDGSGDRPAPFEEELKAFSQPRTWAPKITRVVLLAGMNRGWTVSSALDWITSVKWSILQFLFESIPFGKPTVFAIRRGAPFLVQTRLQWLALMNPNYRSRNPNFIARPDLITVQLLGSGDDQVSPDDNVDYAVDLFGGVGPQSFFYIEVPYSTHPSVVQMAKNGPKGTQPERNTRRQRFILALSADRAQLALASITREQMSDNLPPEPDPSVTDLVFVVHGIRDKGFWTQKIARTIKKHAANNQKIESWTESYGYFAMLPFILRRVRQRKVEWLMDCYTEARARYPNATFHYVGHSNGTYLVAQALHDYPAARFKYIVFAGSVVRCNYDWLSLIQQNPVAPRDKPRVAKVLNYVATHDWVVAMFPKALQPWRVCNLGSAGHDGFSQASPEGPVYEVKYIVGSHGAGHEEPNWDNIAHFIGTGNPPMPISPPVFGTKQSLFWRAMGSISFILFPLIALIVLVIGALLFRSIFSQLPALPCSTIPGLRHWAACAGMPTGNQQALRSFGFFIYLWIVYLFVTQF